jgi:arylsulfatase A-like enzyme
MARPAWIGWIAFGLLLLLPACTGGEDPDPVEELRDLVRSTPLERASLPENPRSIVLISIDTLRADHLSAYGYDRETSPSVDRLASEGILFEEAYSQSPKTASSHMTIMTGVYPEAHGVRNWEEKGRGKRGEKGKGKRGKKGRGKRGENRRLSEEIPTLATVLRRAGYRTVGYAGGGNVAGGLGFNQGFQIYRRVKGAGPVFKTAAAALEELTRPTGTAGHTPFFLFIHTFETHDPYVPPQPYADLYADPDYDGRIVSSRLKLRLLSRGGDWGARHKAYWARVEPESRRDVQHLRDLYDGAIRYTDDQIGGFLERFRTLKLEDEALIVFLSDHGEEFREHGGFRHNDVYQEVLQVPLILRCPGDGSKKAQGRRVKAAVRLLDVMPTLLEFVGLPVPEHAEGRSLLPLLRRAEEAPRPVFSQWRWKHYETLRLGDWKYIRRPSEEELFNLADDPGEKRNLASRHRDRGRGFAGQIAALIETSARFRRAAGGGKPAPLDRKTREELRALGYLGDDL